MDEVVRRLVISPYETTRSQLFGLANLVRLATSNGPTYYQPNPPAYLPFPVVSDILDPDFTVLCSNASSNCDGYGLRIINSSSVLLYGVGLYSFFKNYNTSCSAAGNGETCQPRIFSLEGALSNIDVYNLNTVGATSMIDVSGVSLAGYAQNVNVFPDTIALFRTG